jgi:hypothetical protein
MVLCILTFTFLDSRREDRRLWREWQFSYWNCFFVIFPNFLPVLIIVCSIFLLLLENQFVSILKSL